MRLFEFNTDPSRNPSSVLRGLKRILTMKIVRVGGPKRIYEIAHSNQLGAVYVFDGTVKAFGIAWAKGTTSVESIYVWNNFSINKAPDYELDIPFGVPFYEFVDQIAHWIENPTTGKKPVEVDEEIIDEARRTNDQEFMDMVQRAVPTHAQYITWPEMMKIADENGVQVPGSIRNNQNLKVDVHHWNLSDKTLQDLETDRHNLASELGGPVSSDDEEHEDPDIINLTKLKAVNKIASKGRIYLMAKKANGKFFRIPNIESLMAQMERQLERHIDDEGGYERTSMEEQYDMLSDKVKLVAGGKSAFIKSFLITGAPASGKALALDTPIPTPSGWTTMGELQVGDTVYDEAGKPCDVTFVTPVQLNRKCFELTFDDGTKIVADAEHRWLTSSQASRQSAQRSKKRWNNGVPLQSRGTDQSHKRTFPSIVNTETIANSLYAREKFNHMISNTKPIIGKKTELLINPYVLGVWLGDGTSSNATLSCGKNDIQQLSNLLENEGQEFIVQNIKRDSNFIIRLSNGRGGKISEKFVTKLRNLNLLNNKHIPQDYLRSSVKDRMALLQGLMDTDGCVSSNHCEFTSTRRQLAEEFLDLARGLGIKATLNTGRAILNGVDKGEKYRVIFTTSLPVFRYTRKLDRMNPNIKRKNSITSRTIIDCQEISSVPVKCISVDSPSHLFLCSKSYIPTHNTFVVMNTIKELGLQAGKDYVIKKGRITTPSMYRTLIERINGLVIFDDCDSVVDDKNAVNMLKGALDTDPIRQISYDVKGTMNTATLDDEERQDIVEAMSRILRNKPEPGDLERFEHLLKRKKPDKAEYSDDEDNDSWSVDFDDEDEVKEVDLELLHDIQAYITQHMPNKIDFKGRIIFISNMLSDEWPAAIISRAFTMELNFSSAEMLEYIEKIKNHLDAPSLTEEQKQEVLDFIRELYTMGKLKASINFRLRPAVFRLTSDSKLEEIDHHVVNFHH